MARADGTAMSARWTRVPAGTLAALLSLAAVTACGDADPAPPAATDSTGVEAGSSASEPAGEGSPGASPTVEPATGPWLRFPQAQVRAPEGWQASTNFGTKQARNGVEFVGLNSNMTYGDPAPSRKNLRRGARAEIKLGVYKGKPKVDLDATLAGRPAFRLSGRQALGDDVTYGTIYENHVIGLRFLFRPSTPQAQREEIMESVLATFEYR